MSTYTEGLLASGERILRREHQHWFVLLWTARLAIVAIILALVLLILRATQPSATGGGWDALGILTAVLFVGGLAYLGWTYLRYRSEEYVVTSRRIIHAEGVINKKATDSSLEKINDAQLTQSWAGRIFGFGDLDVMTASESGIEKLRMLIDAPGFKRAMLDAKHELELEYNRPVAPPLRAQVETAGPSAIAGGVAAPPVTPPPARTMTSGELTASLERLADLRDRGALTPAEYESMKADLLAGR